MKLFEIISPLPTGGRGQPGASVDNSRSATYGPQDLKRWANDAKAAGFTVVPNGPQQYSALDREGKITGEFSKRDGGMLAWGV